MKWPKMLSMAASRDIMARFLHTARLDRVRHLRSQEVRSATLIEASFRGLSHTSSSTLESTRRLNSRSTLATWRSTTQMDMTYSTSNMQLHHFSTCPRCKCKKTQVDNSSCATYPCIERKMKRMLSTFSSSVIRIESLVRRQ